MKPMGRISQSWRTMMHKINYEALLKNVDQMINLLEYDSMRNPGKAKLNCGHLESLYNLKDRYSKLIPTKPIKKGDK